ncbi:lysophospholipid acyltransferase family protein [Aequorivita lipolytica]|uniref:1-acyl-sn-glycerol-3-phosphate acyltransferase n=1 Tax=Aequorivita lipolytica TaxID=153267 RepID=A0A5C6YSS2_9FLAO|nr:lysophospholipid acyltransferase family protein [Aequorivita lipolytica]TXD70470.1 1-acyl-sn-glycerol-3-phosphate acyltransferase [Aequorivita lipolytica]SRX50857.1 1-acyl-sn-glycerol-3-phosphate acyltransferase [Aequorivita lipolytica]
MKLFKQIFATFYRIWFYLIIALATILLFPFLIISILKHSWYPFFFKVARTWSAFIIFGIGCYPIIKRDVQYKKGESYMFVANHTSMADIMLMFYSTKNPFVFVGKKELAKIPLFGSIYKRTCILVDRGNTKSRVEAFRRAEIRLNEGLSVCIFPEGGVPDDLSILLDEFKDGAFRLSIEHQIPIAPMTFHDNKKRFPYSFFIGSPGKMRVKVHKLIPTAGLTLEKRKELKKETRTVILNELLHPTV